MTTQSRISVEDFRQRVAKAQIAVQIGTESPIETLMYWELASGGEERGWRVEAAEHVCGPDSGPTLELWTQQPIGYWRTDIYLLLRGHRAGVCLAVECDGDQHREKERFAKDKKRDRYFLMNDIPQLRFTGREINDDVSKCVDEVLDELFRRFTAMLEALADAA